MAPTRLRPQALTIKKEVPKICQVTHLQEVKKVVSARRGLTGGKHPASGIASIMKGKIGLQRPFMGMEG